jgi:hypothetical protein
MYSIDPTIKQRILQNQAEKTAACIVQYRKQHFQLQAEGESLEDVVFYLLDKGNYDESISAYEDLCVVLLCLLSNPEIAALVAKHSTKAQQQQLPTMLYNLYQFFKDLDCDCWRSLLEQKYVELQQAGGDLEHLRKIEAIYQQKRKQHEPLFPIDHSA